MTWDAEGCGIGSHHESEKAMCIPYLEDTSKVKLNERLLKNLKSRLESYFGHSPCAERRLAGDVLRSRLVQSMETNRRDEATPP